MKIGQLAKVIELRENQRVKIRDTRTNKTIESVSGWVIEPEYEYTGFNHEEVERIMDLKVASAKFEYDWLLIWAY